MNINALSRKTSLLILSAIALYMGCFLGHGIEYIPDSPSRFQFILNWLLLPDEILRSFWIPSDWRNAAAEAYFAHYPAGLFPFTRISLIFLVFIISLWTFFWGRTLFNWIAPSSNFDKAERFILSLFLGAGALSLFTAAAAWISAILIRFQIPSLISAPFFWSVFLISAAFNGKNIFHFARRIPSVIQTAFTERRFSFPLILPGLFLLIALIPALLPPWDFDVREYHLESVKEIYLSGALDVFPQNVYANMPLGAESLVLACMNLAGDWRLGALAGKTFLSLSLILSSGLLYCMGKRFFHSAPAGFSSALIYMSIPLIVTNARAGLIDGVLAAYMFAAFYVLLAAEKETENRNRCLFLAGAFIGAAVSIKYTGVVFAAIPAVILILFQDLFLRKYSIDDSPLQKSMMKNSIRSILIFIASSVLFGGIWYLKNACLLGNPVYPLCSVWLGQSIPLGLSNDSLACWQAVHASEISALSSAAKKILEFFFYSNELSPIFIPLGFCSIFLLKNNSVIKIIACYIALYLLLWLTATHGIERFLIPLYPFIAAAGGYTFASLSETLHKTGKRTAEILFGLSLGYSFIWILLPLPGAALGMADNLNAYWAQTPRLGESASWLIANRPDILQQANKENPLVLIGDAAVFDWYVPVEYSVCFNSQSGVGKLKKRLNSPAPLPPAIIVNHREIARYRNTGYGFTSDFSADFPFADFKLTKIYAKEGIEIWAAK